MQSSHIALPTAHVFFGKRRHSRRIQVVENVGCLAPKRDVVALGAPNQGHEDNTAVAFILGPLRDKAQGVEHGRGDPFFLQALECPA